MASPHCSCIVILIFVVVSIAVELQRDSLGGDYDDDDRDKTTGSFPNDVIVNDDEDDKLMRDVVDQFLSKVEQYEKNKDNCTPGTTFNLGDGVVAQYGVRRFHSQAMIAVQRANFLTRIWSLPDAGLLSSEQFLYAAVRSMVEGDSDLFAAGNCYDYMEYKNYTLFCPYAHRMPEKLDRILVKDLSVEYKYLGNDSEFFYQARLKAQGKLEGVYNITRGYSMYRYNETAHYTQVMDDSINIVYNDGHWSKPYFDCRGGDIWMMTYTVPFFGYREGHYYFKGTSGIDIDLQKVDIDQCPSQGEELNVFAGSAKCKPETECVPVPGLGFRRGSYKCECRNGFYFPDMSLPLQFRYYNGSDIELSYEQKLRNEPNNYDESFVCMECAPGCDTCVDDKPCILELNWILRSILLGFSCLTMNFIPVLVCLTYRFRYSKVLKAASPALLRIILAGAFLLYCPMIVSYFEPSEIGCSVRLWMRELGFSISYGALLLKTWRISVVFRVRSAQRIKISDANLTKRLLLITLLFAAFLSIRMVLGRPTVVKGIHSSGLHTFQCSWDVWDYSAALDSFCSRQQILIYFMWCYSFTHS